MQKNIVMTGGKSGIEFETARDITSFNFIIILQQFEKDLNLAPFDMYLSLKIKRSLNSLNINGKPK